MRSGKGTLASVYTARRKSAGVASGGHGYRHVFVASRLLHRLKWIEQHIHPILTYNTTNTNNTENTIVVEVNRFLQ